MGAAGPERFRIAVVHGAKQGSGYLLSPELVLTAGHLVENRYLVRVAALGGVGDVECQVVWSRHDRECDAALLLAHRPLHAPERAAELEQTSVQWGMPLALETMDSCQAVGFPRTARGAYGELDTEQVVGTFKPGSQLVRARYVLDSPHTAPAPHEDGGSPWAGMSGAALFAQGTVIGVVVADPYERWQHGRLEAVRSRVLFDDAQFVEKLVGHTGHQPTLIEFSGPELNPHAGFERRYAEYVAEYYSELTVFGLDFSRRDHAKWPLDTAYLSLELAPLHGREHEREKSVSGVPSGQPSLPEPGGGRQRIEAAFARERRILLRGLAGSGKTTLVQWLAVTAARQEFPPALGHFQGCVPFVLPLRSLARRGSLPEPGEFLAAVGNMLSSAQPQGWADEVLRSGRGLLLVDGVDEVRERDRERTQKWLKGLITLYPDCIYLVTTRPSAVAEGWLYYEEFNELNLLPMNRQDVRAFIRRWHKAAGETTRRPEDRERLEQFEQHLVEVLPRKQDLARLATNPLMCAMICALNRDRKTKLPQSRLTLYGAALSMLLIRRDVEREVTTAEADHSDSGVNSALSHDEDAQRLLLQDLAYWMIRNGHVEASRPEALHVVAQTLGSMPQIAPPEEASRVLDHLVLRCGLLRAPTVETVEFVHRTFQDYLGAKAAVEAQDLNLIAAHAHEPQWEDVVRMAIGHARTGERAVLLKRLLHLGDESGHPQRERLHLLAAACLEHATSLAPEVRTEVQQRASALVPPQSLAEAERLAEAGTIALDLIPSPEALTPAQVRPVAHTARLLGGEHAFQVLRTLRSSVADDVRQELADAWDRFDPRAYADDVLRHVRPDGIEIVVTGREQLAALHLLDTVAELRCVGDFSADDMAPALRCVTPRTLTVESNDRLADLRFLAEQVPELTSLSVLDCGGLVDYTALPRLPLRSLTLQDMPSGPDFAPLTRIGTLREGRFLWGRQGAPRPVPIRDLPFPPELESLVCAGNLTVGSLTGIARWSRLRNLDLHLARPLPAEQLTALVEVPSLRSVSLNAEGLNRLEPGSIAPAPNVTDATLHVTETSPRSSTEWLRTLFPGLESLHLITQHEVAGGKAPTLDLAALSRKPPTVDLSALVGLSDLRVDVVSTAGVRVTGADGLPPGSVKVSYLNSLVNRSASSLSRRFGRR